MKIKEWILFIALGIIWGSSFMWIRIGVTDVGPFTLVAFRLLFGLLGLVVAMYYYKEPYPFQPSSWPKYIIMAVFSIVIPFLSISWGETRIESGLASILNATMPLFTIVIAHYWLHDEKITLLRIGGLVLGFVGVVILLSKDITQAGLHADFLGQLAVILGAVAYAVAAIFSRRYLRGEKPVVQSTMILIFANIMMWPLALLLQTPFRMPSVPLSWVSFIWLGLLGLCIAYLIFFHLINVWGATRTSLVTYLYPFMGLTLGVIFLTEKPDWRILVGFVLVFSGIVIVNWRTNDTPSLPSEEIHS
jgi:drug/metabolite transporter (DMT)-like permease